MAIERRTLEYGKRLGTWSCVFRPIPLVDGYNEAWILDVDGVPLVIVADFGLGTHRACQIRGPADRRVDPDRRTVAVVFAASLPDPEPEPDPETRRLSRPRPVPFRRTRGPGRSRSTTELRARGPVHLRGRRKRHIAARRVCDPERGPSRRHRAGDLPLSCQRRRMDLREPTTGRRRIVGQRGPDRHPRQDRDHSGQPSGLVEPVAGKPGRLRDWSQGTRRTERRSGLIPVWRPRMVLGARASHDDPLAWYARNHLTQRPDRFTADAWPSSRRLTQKPDARYLPCEAGSRADRAFG